MSQRTCTGCGVPKAPQAFYDHPTGKDGKTAKCRLCLRALSQEQKELKRVQIRAADRRRYYARREHKLAQARTYHATPAGKEARRLATRAWRVCHPEQFAILTQRSTEKLRAKRAAQRLLRDQVRNASLPAHRPHHPDISNECPG